MNNKYNITAGKFKSSIKSDSGVEIPATDILIYPDGISRLVFYGCRPHDCPSANAYFLLDPTNKNIDIIWNAGETTKYFGPNAELLKQNNIAYYLMENSSYQQAL